MKKKRKIEADLDPPNARNTRFGSKTVETALKNAGPPPAKPKRPAPAKPKRSR